MPLGYFYATSPSRTQLFYAAQLKRLACVQKCERDCHLIKNRKKFNIVEVGWTEVHTKYWNGHKNIYLMQHDRSSTSARMQHANIPKDAFVSPRPPIFSKQMNSIILEKMHAVEYGRQSGPM